MASEAAGGRRTPPARYPRFDVMAEQRAWDPVTRAIVAARLSPARPRVLGEAEAQTLTAVARQLLDEERPEVLAFVVAHFDGRMRSHAGEGQREEGVPAEADLLRRGLAALDRAAGGGAAAFAGLPAARQTEVLAALAKGRAGPADAFAGLPQTALFTRLLGRAAEALASHPAVWSEIGYAGPAHPRGYYRMRRGVLDPWEPRADPALRRRSAGGGRSDGTRDGPVSDGSGPAAREGGRDASPAAGARAGSARDGREGG